MNTKRQYIAVFEPEPGQSEQATIRALRHILKRLGRNYHVKCKSIREAKPQKEGDEK